jgi:hypothetical protein
MIMCHLFADTTDELNRMADAIGIARKWIQYPGTPKEHFDISKSKRALAIMNGAIELTSARSLIAIIRRKAKAYSLPSEVTLPISGY